MAKVTQILLLGLLALISLVEAQIPCVPLVESTYTAPLATDCTWQWLMYYPTPIGPTCTIYTSILTVVEDYVDCDFCMVKNTPAPIPPPGKCIATVTATTAWNVSSMGCRESSTPANAFIQPSATPSTTSQSLIQQFPTPLGKREAPTSNDTSSPSLTSQESAILVKQIATALEIVSQVASGENLTILCTELDAPESILGPEAATLNVTTIQEVVCSLSVIEKEEVVSTTDQLLDLAAALAVIDVSAGMVGTTDLNVLCKTIDFPFLTIFHINWQALKRFICNAAKSVPKTGSLTVGSVTSSWLTGSPSISSSLVTLSSSSVSIPSDITYNSSFPGITIGSVATDSIWPSASSSPKNNSRSHSASPSGWPVSSSSGDLSPSYPMPSNLTSSSTIIDIPTVTVTVIPLPLYSAEIDASASAKATTSKDIKRKAVSRDERRKQFPGYGEQHAYGDQFARYG